MMKRAIRIIQTAVLAAVLVNTTTSQGAMTAVQTAAYGAASNGTFTDLGDGNFISVVASAPLSGFTKFDPSLGTLTEIRFTIEMDADLTLELQADQLDPITATDFTVSFDPSAGSDSLTQAGIIYSPTGSTSGLTATADVGTVPNLGVTDEPSGPYVTNEGEGPQFFYEESVSEPYGGFASGGNTETLGTLDFSNPNFLMSDFVGSGAVAGLDVKNIFLLSNEPSMLMLNNIPGAFIQPEVSFAAGNATLQYVYTPVPEPAAGILTLLGLVVALRRQR